MECRLLSLNEHRNFMDSVGDRECFTGCERAKGRFTATALRSARRHAKLVIAAHPNVAPIVQGMRIAAPRMKSIVVAHGIEIWEPLPTLRRRALRRANVILTPTQDTANHVATQQQIPRDKIRVLPWALDTEFGNLSLPLTHNRRCLPISRGPDSHRRPLAIQSAL